MLFPPIGTFGFNVLWDPGTIYAQWFDEEGNPVGNDFILCAQSKGSQALAYLHFNNDKRQYFAVWSDERNAGAGKDIYGALFQSPQQFQCSATALLGDDDPRLDTLRQFRDEKLATSILGSKMIELYYEKSRDIIDMCKQSPAVKWFFKNMLERMIPVIEVML